MRLNKTLKFAAGIAVLGLLAGCAGGFSPAQDTAGFATDSTSFSPNNLNHPDIAGGPPDLVSHSSR